MFDYSYQKTSEAVKIASEKTTSVIGSLGGSVARKLGEVKNSNAFKSFEERVGSAVTNVRVRMRLEFISYGKQFDLRSSPFYFQVLSIKLNQT